MLQKILVPLDGSTLSEKALNYAKRIIAPDGMIFLLTVVDRFAAPVSDDRPFGTFVELLAFPSAPGLQEPRPVGSIAVDAIHPAEAYLRRIADRLWMGSHKVDICVEADVSPAEAIVQMAADLQVDAIVIATHGRSGLSRFVFGSVTYKVLNSLPCPVFVIPAQDRTEQ